MFNYLIIFYRLYGVPIQTKRLHSGGRSSSVTETFVFRHRRNTNFADGRRKLKTFIKVTDLSGDRTFFRLLLIVALS
jgi:hypothetical protein